MTKKIVLSIFYFLFLAGTIAFIVFMSIYGTSLKTLSKIKSGDYILKSELNSSTDIDVNEELKLRIADLTKMLEEQRQINNDLKARLQIEQSRNDTNEAEIARLYEQIEELTKSIQAKEQLLVAYEQYENTSFILTFYNDDELLATRVVNAKSPTDYSVDLPAKTATHKCIGWSVDGVLVDSSYVPTGNTRFYAVWAPYTFLTEYYPAFEGLIFTSEYYPEKLQFIGNQFKLMSDSDGSEVVTDILSVTKRDSDFEIYDVVYSDTEKFVIQPACDDKKNDDNNEATSHFHLVQVFDKLSSGDWQESSRTYFYYY